MSPARRWTLSGLLLGILPLTMGAPALAASAPQWRLLKAAAKRVDDAGLATRGAKGFPGRARRAFERTPAVPGKKAVVLGMSDEGLRVFTADGPGDGVLFPKVADAVDHYSPTKKDLAVSFDPHGEPLELAKEFAGAGFDVGLLDDDGARLELAEIQVDGAPSWHVAARPGLLIPIGEDDQFGRISRKLGRRFNVRDTTLVTASGQPTGALLAAAGFRSRVELGVPTELSELAGESEGHPIFALGPLGKSALGELITFAEGHDCPLLVLNAQVDQPVGPLEEETVLGLVSRFVPEEDPWRYAEEQGPGESDVWLNVQGESTPANPVGLSLGIDSRGMTAPYTLAVIAIFFLVLGYLPGQAVGHVLAWPLGWVPKRLRGLQLSFLGMLPFFPFGEDGCFALMITGIWIAAATVIGWVLGWPLGFRPAVHRVPKFAIIGSVVLGLLMGGAWVLPKLQEFSG